MIIQKYLILTFMNPEIFLHNTAYSAQLHVQPVSPFKLLAENLFYYYHVLFSFYIFRILPHVNYQQLVLHLSPPLSLPLGADFTLELVFNVLNPEIQFHLETIIGSFSKIKFKSFHAEDFQIFVLLLLKELAFSFCFKKILTMISQASPFIYLSIHKFPPEFNDLVNSFELIKHCLQARNQGGGRRQATPSLIKGSMPLP